MGLDYSLSPCPVRFLCVRPEELVTLRGLWLQAKRWRYFGPRYSFRRHRLIRSE